MNDYEAEDYERPTWDEYFLEVMHAIGRRGNCNRGRSGAVLVKDNSIIATGYVGAPAGLPTCDEVGHLFKTVIKEDGTKKQHCVRTTHAEMNAIIQAARSGVSCEGGVIYCKMSPCIDCTKAIINAGIKKVIAEFKYHAAAEELQMLKDAGVELVIVNDKILEYEGQEKN